MSNLTIRRITREEYPILEDFLYHAIFLSPGIEPLPREVIFGPEIFVYIKDFGGKDDCGVLAEQGEQIIGAAWTRIIPAYGHIDDKTPELAISVLPNFRGKGVGSKIKENPAVRFYERLGYQITEERIDHANHGDYLMIKYL